MASRQGPQVLNQKSTSTSFPVRWRRYSHGLPSSPERAKLSSLRPTTTHEGTGVTATGTRLAAGARECDPEGVTAGGTGGGPGSSRGSGTGGGSGERYGGDWL